MIAGAKMYILGNATDTIYAYDLGTAFDISTAVYNGENFDLSVQDTDVTDVAFNNDGTKMYIAGTDSKTSGSAYVYEYNLSTAWDVSTASFVQSLQTGTEDESPRSIEFKPDGTRMYIGGAEGAGISHVYRYDLSTAWDISTASYINNYNSSTQTGYPSGLEFNLDGTKMYLTDANNNILYSYSLSTAWDITTASVLNSYDVSTQDTACRGLVFNDDGTKIYHGGQTNDNVYSYNLSTAYDISTASYNQSFDISGQDGSIVGVEFGEAPVAVRPFSHGYIFG